MRGATHNNNNNGKVNLKARLCGVIDKSRLCVYVCVSVCVQQWPHKAHQLQVQDNAQSAGCAVVVVYTRTYTYI